MEYSYAVKGLIYYNSTLASREVNIATAHACLETMFCLSKHYVDAYMHKSTTKASVLRNNKMNEIVNHMDPKLEPEFPLELCDRYAVTQWYKELTVHSQFVLPSDTKYGKIRPLCYSVVNWFFKNLTEEMKVSLAAELGTAYDDAAKKNYREFIMDIIYLL